LNRLIFLPILVPLCSSSATAFAEPPLKPVPERAQAARFAQDVLPLLNKYCFACHQGEKARGGVAFNTFKNEASAIKSRETWEKVARNIESGMMPPDDKPQPSEDERALLLGWIESRVLQVDCSQINPGRVTIRRLNRIEYDNTIRDLLGVDFHPADDFPSDDVGYGFDNIGDVLSLPPILLEKYLAAAEKITDAAIRTRDPARAPRKTAPGGPLASVGDITGEFEFPVRGEYALRVRAFGQQAGDEPARMTVKLDGAALQTFDVTAEKSAETYEIRMTVEPGKRKLAARFINDYYKPDDPNPNNRDRNLIVEQLEVQGPLGVLPDALPESHRRLITTLPERREQVGDCARAILKTFASRAFRRPATDDELRRLTAIVESVVNDGDEFERGIQIAMQGVLVSPHFLFRVEADDPAGAAGSARTLNDYELSTRLSYFLWSSMPDDELFRIAAEGTLRSGGNLEAQVRRMLKNPKAAALGENFAGQWLQLRNLKNAAPALKRFPDFDEKLRDAMETETKLFFAEIVREDRSILDFLDARFTYVNERLAKHYGIPDVTGDEFRRIDLATDERGGLLGQAGILLVTSNPTRTSPVKRGKWILENILASPPPPPPPGVPELAEEPERERGRRRRSEDDSAPRLSLRQKMEKHRENPACAACHTQMDALGFGLENYDAVGAWRSKDGDLDIDASGTLPGGKSFSTPSELKQILRSRSDDFRRCLAEKLLTYALGRGLEYYDKCTIDQIVRNISANHDRFSSLVLEIVRSDPFQKRRN
jgi:hypothetical protein